MKILTSELMESGEYDLILYVLLLFWDSRMQLLLRRTAMD